MNISLSIMKNISAVRKSTEHRPRILSRNQFLGISFTVHLEASSLAEDQYHTIRWYPEVVNCTNIRLLTYPKGKMQVKGHR